MQSLNLRGVKTQLLLNPPAKQILYQSMQYNEMIAVDTLI